MLPINGDGRTTRSKKIMSEIETTPEVSKPRRQRLGFRMAVVSLVAAAAATVAACLPTDLQKLAFHTPGAPATQAVSKTVAFGSWTPNTPYDVYCAAPTDIYQADGPTGVANFLMNCTGKDGKFYQVRGYNKQTGGGGQMLKVTGPNAWCRFQVSGKLWDTSGTVYDQYCNWR